MKLKFKTEDLDGYSGEAIGEALLAYLPEEAYNAVLRILKAEFASYCRMVWPEQKKWWDERGAPEARPYWCGVGGLELSVVAEDMDGYSGEAVGEAFLEAFLGELSGGMSSKLIGLLLDSEFQVFLMKEWPALRRQWDTDRQPSQHMPPIETSSDWRCRGGQMP